VEKYMKMGRSGARDFIITGTKVASDVTIPTVDERGKRITSQIGIDIPVASMTVGPKEPHEASHYEKTTRSIGGPIVLSFKSKRLV
jgi:hypothetical protein